MVIWMTEILKEYIYNMTFWQGVISSIVIALFIKSGRASRLLVASFII